MSMIRRYGRVSTPKISEARGRLRLGLSFHSGDSRWQWPQLIFTDAKLAVIFDEDDDVHRHATYPIPGWPDILHYYHLAIARGVVPRIVEDDPVADAVLGLFYVHISFLDM